MTLAACPLCGTQTDPGAVCYSCGTPVPVERPVGAGQAAYWEKVRVRLVAAVRPRYELRSLLGYGGMAGVFAADEPRLGRSVALKVMSPALMLDEQLVERFAQEARTIALLNHPNIITVYEVDERDDLHWFVMAFVAGRTLAEVMTDAQGPLPIAVVRAWLYQVCDALSYAHERGVVHRDVKPGNVLLAPRGDALVTDFGIAKVADTGSGLTRTGMLVGTPTYMSPEQCTSAAVTGASDQYSLGAVVYQMVTGTPPFTGPTMSVLRAHVGEAPVPIRELRPDCPAELAEAVERMLEKRPEDRYPDMSSVIAASGATPPALTGPVRTQMEELAALAVSLEVVPSPVTMREGSREPLRAAVLGIGARPLSGRVIYWSSSAPGVAAVVGNNLTAFGPGRAEIGAASASAATSFEVEVEADPVAGVVLPRGPESVAVGATAPLRAEALDLDGTVLEGRALQWHSSDAQVARVSSEGVVYGVATGEAIISAHTGGKFATVTVTVHAPVEAAAAGGGTQPPPQARRATPVQVTPGAQAAEPAGRRAEPGAATSSAAGSRLRPAVLAGAALLVFGEAAGAGLAPWLQGRSRRADLPAAPAPAVRAPLAPEEPSRVSGGGGSAAYGGGSETPVPPAADVALGGEGRDQGAAAAPPAREAAPGRSEAGVAAANAAQGRQERDSLPRVPAQVVSDAAVQPPPLPEPGRPAVAQGAATVTTAVRDTEADRREIEQAVRAYVGAFAARDAATVLPLMPADERTRWAAFFGSQDIADFTAALTDLGPANVTGDTGTIQFGIAVRFRNVGQIKESVPHFTAHAARTGSGWELRSLRTP